ncbi:hypothetical protein L596_030416 [Steinernema carpocapsae]|uniref:Uncharacterized protein n=1 Tax=Steinernema carpocapsae TaxID=34508 RepID=A0A4U5LPB3_STECR|nr:hypothetical protein L596_030416 [Steinernema carpocapsae]
MEPPVYSYHENLAESWSSDNDYSESEESVAGLQANAKHDKNYRCNTASAQVRDLLYNEMGAYKELYSIGTQQFRRTWKSFKGPKLDSWKKLVATVQEQFPHATEGQLANAWAQLRSNYTCSKPILLYKQWIGKLDYLEELRRPKQKRWDADDEANLKIIVEEMKEFPDISVLPLRRIAYLNFEGVEDSWKSLVSKIECRNPQLTEKEILRIWRNALYRDYRKKRHSKPASSEDALLLSLHNESLQSNEPLLYLLMKEVKKWKSLWEVKSERFVLRRGLLYHQKAAWDNVVKELQKQHDKTTDQELRVMWSKFLRMDKAQNKALKEKAPFLSTANKNGFQKYFVKIFTKYSQLHAASRNDVLHHTDLSDRFSVWTTFLQEIQVEYPEVEDKNLRRRWLLFVKAQIKQGREKSIWKGDIEFVKKIKRAWDGNGSQDKEEAVEKRTLQKLRKRKRASSVQEYTGSDDGTVVAISDGAILDSSPEMTLPPISSIFESVQDQLPGKKSPTARKIQHGVTEDKNAAGHT